MASELQEVDSLTLAIPEGMFRSVPRRLEGVRLPCEAGALVAVLPQALAATSLLNLPDLECPRACPLFQCQSEHGVSPYLPGFDLSDGPINFKQERLPLVRFLSNDCRHRRNRTHSMQLAMIPIPDHYADFAAVALTKDLAETSSGRSV